MSIESEPQERTCFAAARRRSELLIQKVRQPGRWVFVEWKKARCRECGTFLAHSWNHSSGSTIKGSLCTVCVAQHIGVRR
jgi:hypothetical protein